MARLYGIFWLLFGSIFVLGKPFWGRCIQLLCVMTVIPCRAFALRESLSLVLINNAKGWVQRKLFSSCALNFLAAAGYFLVLARHGERAEKDANGKARRPLASARARRARGS